MTATNVSGNSTFNFVLTVSTLAPNLTADSPLSVPQNASRSYSATNIGGVATSWSWNFGGGASPNTSTASNPTVTITGTNGSTYNCSVTATNGGGNSTFNFVMTVTMPLPNITSVTPLSGPSGANQSFSLINAGGRSQPTAGTLAAVLHRTPAPAPIRRSSLVRKGSTTVR